MRYFLGLALLMFCFFSSFGEAGRAAEELFLLRKYSDGEVLQYEMTGKNKNANTTRTYSASAVGRVSREEASQKFCELLKWSNLTVDEKIVELPEASQNFVQKLSLDSAAPLPFPNVSVVHPNLIGPIFDMMTFYVDERLAIDAKFSRVGDVSQVIHNKPNSWADGRYVIVGEDCINFELSLKERNNVEKTAKVLVKHVPPSISCVQLSASWMKKPVMETENNWVQVTKEAEDRYIAAVGKEVFDVTMTVDTSAGKILDTTLINPVEVFERVCSDAALSSCGEGKRYQILREIDLRLK